MFRVLPLAALLLPLTLATAQADMAVSTQTVSYGDLNPFEPSDAKVLASRLEAAAQAVCEKANVSIPASPKKAAAMQQCVDSAITAALGQIGSHVTRTVEANLAKP